MVCLSKEATNKDHNLKMQILLSIDDDKKNLKHLGQEWIFLGSKGRSYLFQIEFLQKYLSICLSRHDFYYLL